jgi:hypothetical protein
MAFLKGIWQLTAWKIPSMLVQCNVLDQFLTMYDATLSKKLQETDIEATLEISSIVSGAPSPFLGKPDIGSSYLVFPIRY